MNPRYVLKSISKNLYILDTKKNLYAGEIFHASQREEAVERLHELNQQEAEKPSPLDSFTEFIRRQINRPKLSISKPKTEVEKQSKSQSVVPVSLPMSLNGQEIVTKNNISVFVYGNPVEVKNPFTGQLEWGYTGIDQTGLRTIVFLSQMKGD